MRDRKKALERLLAVKTKMRELEEARLAEIERMKRQAQEDRRAMLGFLDRAEAKDALLLGLACRRVAAAERGAAALEAQADAQREIVLRRTAQRRGVEKLLREAGDALEREEEKRRLLELGERLAKAPPTSLP
ncbi:hypothetical protein K9U39_00765 [Rhodoblastus acidophilus]|uniref:Flagellar FliJ protein n=1 Tax=Candidatus Rhodoblastus alkanivorans TaxID=2954117 RepID=A0ABS9Z3F3_9HYPH|nr:hypothetical protein [Candidatus Rhodoblastus alkanivorans]MCI4678800.1 hypothetical protein [Candidatus Rhodoblastus alkanivorans]MCI4682189.1 hypothetical protein [Candidatus Rhodoblastus alkanivorans]MDI4639491.1 hypothetical protein [Rhodoblastus acidophilus]